MNLKKFDSNDVFKVAIIKTWLIDNHNSFQYLLNEISCNKWKVWLEDKATHIYPCVCSKRDQNCIFIETYYKLEEIVELHSKEEYFNTLVESYKLIAQDKKGVLDWYKKYQSIASELVFEAELSILIQLEPYKSLKIKLNENEFRNIIEFQSIFNELEYNQIIKP
ncbi:MAG TPA: hypothetical protein PLL09_11670 [Flavobacterium sp.]|uniref:hypothetical protein n=1 Tax=unclassified Flavobacterium TaxID=196869 RepID=UPI0025BAE77B|nr:MULTISPECIES: hypothetical protein [unclassified Flavobacterium]HRE78468.1 hypothetical protein [Flavobacterium sp.]